MKAEADLEWCKHMCRRAKKQLLLEKYYKIITLNSPSWMLQPSLDPPLERTGMTKHNIFMDKYTFLKPTIKPVSYTHLTLPTICSV